MNPISPSEIVINRAQGLNFLKTRLIVHQTNYLNASTYYSSLYYAYFISTTILICCASILSFLVSSNAFSAEANQWMSLTAGILSILSATIHSFYNGFSVQTKAFAFKQASRSFNSLAESLIQNGGMSFAEKGISSCEGGREMASFRIPSSHSMGYRFFQIGQISASDYQACVEYFQHEQLKIQATSSFPLPLWVASREAIEC